MQAFRRPSTDPVLIDLIPTKSVENQGEVHVSVITPLGREFAKVEHFDANPRKKRALSLNVKTEPIDSFDKIKSEFNFRTENEETELGSDGVVSPASEESMSPPLTGI